MLKNYGRLDNRYFLTKLKKIASYCEGSVLDIGGYTGELARFVSGRYYMIENDDDAIKAAASKGIFSIKADLNTQSISHLLKVDCVVLSDLLDIVWDGEKLLSEAIKLSKGKVVLSVTNDNTIYHRIKVLFGRGINSTPFCLHYHIRHPTFKQWNEMIDRHLVCKDVSYWICFRKEKPLWIDWILLKLAILFPNLFARGAVISCELPITPIS